MKESSNRAIVRAALVCVAVASLCCATLDAALTVSPSSKTLAVGETVALIASGPVQTWTSSNTAIATVSSVGLVTGIGAGQATITAKYHGTKVSMIVTVTGPTPPPELLLTCPANQTIASTDGGAMTTTYSATASGGTAPIVTAYTPTSGSAFSVGTSLVQVSATSADGQGAACAFTVTVTYTPATDTRGPSASITCPGGAVAVSAGASTIQSAVTANPGATTFCLGVGTYAITSAVTPKTGDTFVCAFGAILDGTSWVTSDTSQAAFRAHNQDIDDVTIKNCVIQHMPQRGVHFLGGTDRWIVEHNEITTTVTAVNIGAGSDAIVRLNLLHHNTSGGYLSFTATSPTLEDNEISYNGTEQKFVASTGAIVRKNFVHHNTGDGIWFDTQNTGYVIDLNTVEDNTRFGIHSEISGQGTIQSNTVSRSGDTGIMIVTSKQVEVTGNTLTDNFRGVQLYLKCSIVGGGSGYDLTSNNVHDNTITITTSARSGAWATTLGWPSSDTACTATFVAPYLNNAKSNLYQANTYTVPNATTKWWMWGQGQFKTWAEWQSLGMDTTGSVH